MASNTGKARSYCDYGKMKAWLMPFIESAQSVGYPPDRNMKAANKERLCSDKYQKLFSEGLAIRPYSLDTL